MKKPFTDSHQKWFRYRLATSSLFMSKSHVDPKKGDVIGVGKSRRHLSTSSITALKWSQSLKLWKR
ncbi:Hypothetical protein FKW44_000308 [Caligus rogercresseyi]|uniref:Uncharacterized protein n=1 Tax=Caligus rogercresseyi TaxID=217165 RepID=A0A7T8QUT2_CALRO|nr:Hypothetical protein FKW44_000308 [Caligus rogercresseyi]